MEVSSDFELALKVRDAQGRTKKAGEFSRHTDEYPRANVVPHLQRLDPSRRFLATFDEDGSAFVLHRIDGHAAAPRTVSLSGLKGKPKQVRWNTDGRSMIIATTAGLFQAPLVADGKATQTTASGIDLPRDAEVEDVRLIKDGMIVRASHEIEPLGVTEPLEYEPTDFIFGGGTPPLELRVGMSVVEENEMYLYEGRPKRQQLYYVALGEAGSSKAVALVGADHEVRGAMPLGDGTIAVAVAPFDRADAWAEADAERLDIVKPSGNRWKVVSSTKCDDNDCNATNWAPGASQPIFASYDELVIGGPDGKRLEFDGEIGVLWAHPKTGSILVADSGSLTLLDDKGIKKWSWDLPKADTDDDIEIRSAMFVGDTEAVMVATDREVLRVVEGRASRKLRIKSFERYEEGENDEGLYVGTTVTRRLDSVVALPGGGFAYGVLDTETVEESM